MSIEVLKDNLINVESMSRSMCSVTTDECDDFTMTTPTARTRDDDTDIDLQTYQTNTYRCQISVSRKCKSIRFREERGAKRVSFSLEELHRSACPQRVRQDHKHGQLSTSSRRTGQSMYTTAMFSPESNRVMGAHKLFHVLMQTTDYDNTLSNSVLKLKTYRNVE